MANYTKAGMDYLLKDWYDKYVPQFNSRTPLLNALKGRKRRVKGGRKVTNSLELYGSKSAAARAEGDEFPTSTTTVGVQQSIYMKKTVGKWGLSEEAILAASGMNDTAFAAVLDKSLTRAAEDMRFDIERQWAGLGDGVLAVVNVADNGTAITAGNSDTITLNSASTGGYPGNRYLRVGEILDLYDNAASTAWALQSTAVGKLEVTAVSSDGTTVTLKNNNSSATVTFATGDVLVREGVRKDGGNSDWDTAIKEMMGLRGITDNGTDLGTIHGLSRTTYPALKGFLNHNSGTLRDFTLPLFDNTVDGIELQSGGKVSHAFCNRAMLRVLRKLQTDVRTFDTQKTAMGAAKPSIATLHGDLTPVEDIFGYPNQITLLSMDDIDLYVLQDIGTWKPDGQTFSRATDNTHTRQFVMQYFANLATSLNCAQGRLDDLNPAYSGDADVYNLRG